VISLSDLSTILFCNFYPCLDQLLRFTMLTTTTSRAVGVSFTFEMMFEFFPTCSTPVPRGWRNPVTRKPHPSHLHAANCPVHISDPIYHPPRMDFPPRPLPHSTHRIYHSWLRHAHLPIAPLAQSPKTIQPSIHPLALLRHHRSAPEPKEFDPLTRQRPVLDKQWLGRIGGDSIEITSVLRADPESTSYLNCLLASALCFPCRPTADPLECRPLSPPKIPNKPLPRPSALQLFSSNYA